MRRFGRIPRHCRSCGKRFYVRAQEAGGQGPGEDTAAEPIRVEFPAANRITADGGEAGSLMAPHRRLTAGGPQRSRGLPR